MVSGRTPYLSTLMAATQPADSVPTSSGHGSHWIDKHSIALTHSVLILYGPDEMARARATHIKAPTHRVITPIHPGRSSNGTPRFMATSLHLMSIFHLVPRRKFRNHKFRNLTRGRYSMSSRQGGMYCDSEKSARVADYPHQEPSGLRGKCHATQCQLT